MTITPRYIAYANTKEAPIVNIIDFEKFFNAFFEICKIVVKKLQITNIAFNLTVNKP